ncbi:Cytoplasmic tRNA 2-thiolation protein 2 [Porphyridium purpureum]|uniref:Cytoplasmic tRNA 2-thiolation protein 2 n=1 Tax=Porphyridium purpureum TaxID=35688 RepID=A0A5J4ZA91_PORPP|nr:Cytoplasmic tRNA 2-thiolation protein 2 [Porphyridium purpureum]|eukprot:POR6287..scf295_1
MAGEHATCGKCRTAAATVYQDGGGVRCFACFESALVSGVKAAMAKHKMIGFRETVGLAVSGGVGSMAFAILMRNILRTAKNLQCTLVVLHVVPDDARRARAAYLGEWAHDAGMRFSSSELHESSNTLLDLVTDASDRVRVRKLAVHHALRRLGAEHKCSKILLATTATQLACDILSELAVGAGYNMYEACASSVENAPIQPPFYRPLRDVSKRQLVRYALGHGLYEQLYPCTVAMLPSPIPTIQSTVEQFIVDLQKQRASTCATVVRTAGRLGGVPDCDDIDGADHAAPVLCAVCLGKAEPSDWVAKARGPDFRELEVERDAAACSSYANALCHACSGVASRMRHRSADLGKVVIDRMRERREIEEFLL